MQNTGFCNDSIRKRWRLPFFHFLFFFLLFFYFLFFYEILCYHFFVILSHHCNFCPTIPLPEDSGGDCLYFFFHLSFFFLLHVFYVILWYHLALCNVCVLVRMAGPKPFLKNWFAAANLLFSFLFFRKEEEVGIT